MMNKHRSHASLASGGARFIRARRGLPDAALILVVLILDRLTKRWAAAVLSPDGARSLIDGVVGLRFTLNRGIAFGALGDAGALLIVLTALLIAAMLVWRVRKPHAAGWFRFGAALVIAGGLGNLYDRIVTGEVVDFIELLFVRFAIFNVADIAVVAGTGCLIVAILRGEV